jgi:hypothetical protein
MANRNFANSRIYTGHVMPVLIDCNFVVDSTNGNGLGIRSLKGPYVQNVFMHTSATPGPGNVNPMTPNSPVINPNPAAGTIIVQMQDNYNRVYNGGYSIISPVGSSQIITSGLTAGVAYTVTVVGDATTADWLAIGVPAGDLVITAPSTSALPLVGTSFIASSTGSGASTVSRVAPSASTGSTVAAIETVGDPNASSAPLPKSPFGAQIILQARNFSNALAAPADGSIISLSFLLSNSSVLIQGE